MSEFRTVLATLITVEWKGGRKDGDVEQHRQQWRVPDGFRIVGSLSSPGGNHLQIVVSECPSTP